MQSIQLIILLVEQLVILMLTSAGLCQCSYVLINVSCYVIYMILLHKTWKIKIANEVFHNSNTSHNHWIEFPHIAFLFFFSNMHLFFPNFYSDYMQFYAFLKLCIIKVFINMK